MKSNEIRESYLNFFKSKSHIIKESSSLIPEGDPTLLFTGAGMNQFKKEFLGIGNPELKRVVTCQKCFRTSDIEEVGKTGRHHTFFEMLGNFSFGDYFKEEAITWAWEYVREILKIKKEVIWITVFKDDEESYKIWNKEIGIPPERIVSLGEDTNFWDMGPTGPCGPCSEIIIDRGEKYGNGKENCGIECDEERYLELWNLVFTQFDRKENGKLLPLPQKNIDTGMGLERACSLLQNVEDNFRTDIFLPIIHALEEISEKKYEDYKYNFRVIADHIRGITFLINDGILPSNIGRGYVLRRLIRRALSVSKKINLKIPFLYKLIPEVVEIMRKPYSDLEIRKEHIIQVVHSEEVSFSRTLEGSSEVIKSLIQKYKKEKIFPGKELFYLYDTYGFPLEFAKEIVKEEGLKLDMNGFEEEMKKQKERARISWNKDAREISSEEYSSIKERIREIEFTGYEKLEGEGKILSLLKDGKEIGEIKEGEKGEAIISPTPFYSELGGQVGDKGWIKGKGGKCRVLDSYFKENLRITLIKCIEGRLRKGEEIIAEVDKKRRKRIAIHHTTTHLLQYALRKIIGTHVYQAGSWVGEESFRFDFTHFKSLHPEEIKKIEELVNQKIRENSPVEIKYLPLEEAKKEGAIALFGEKYGKIVRMVKIGDYSKELCGGTHLSYTGEAGIFLILRESSIGAGIRRIEGIAGDIAYQKILKEREIIENVSEILKIPEEKMEERIKEIINENKSLNKEKEILRKKEIIRLVKDSLSNPQKTGEINFYIVEADNLSKNEMRESIDYMKNKIKEKGVFLTIAKKENSIRITLGITQDLISKGANAGKLLKDIAEIVGGGGGGRKDLAEAGGKKPEKLHEALEKLKKSLKCL